MKHLISGSARPAVQEVQFLLLERLRAIRNFVSFNNALTRRNRKGSSQLIVGSRLRGMILDVPVSSVHRLPKTVEVGLPIDSLHSRGSRGRLVSTCGAVAAPRAGAGAAGA